MKTKIFLLLFAAGIACAYAQEGSSTNLKLIPSQERIPQADGQPRIDPEYVIPPIGNPPSSPPAPIVSALERGKWYVQIGAYTRVDLVEDAVKRAGTTGPLVIHNAGTDINPMFRLLLGPFSQSESKTVLRRFRDKGYDAFLRNP